ncbi:MAG: cell wall hydrolase [Schaedlerella arabinosiphila]|nr:cell wall hydrolase [Schaedlerella arabinosiphila]
MKQYRKIIALLMAATTSVVMSSEFESQAADPALDMAQVKILGEYKLTQPYGFNDAPEEALLNLKKATAQAEEQYQEMKRKEKEARERKAAEEARKAQEEAERIAAQQAAAEQAAAEQAAAQQAAAEQATVQQAAEQQTAVQQTAAYSASASDQTLLAAIIFCEAGNQPYEGQVAVGAVIMNRVRSAVYPNSIAEVIYQPGQFGPAMTGWLDSILASGGYTDTAMQAAADALAGSNPIGDCLYFGCGNFGIQIGDHFFH